MSGTTQSWGKEHERIKDMLEEGCSPASDDARRIVDNLFAMLEKRLANLSAREQRVFRYIFYQTLGTKAAIFLMLIDLHEGRRLHPDEARSVSDQYMNAALHG